MKLTDKLVNHFLFTPAKEYHANAAALQTNEDFLTLPAGQKIYFRYRRIPGATWNIINCHGNRRNMSLIDHAYKIYENLPANFILFDYPGYGQSEGEPSEEGCYTAFDAVLNWAVNNWRVPTDNIIVHGLSMGGAVAIEALARHKLKAGIIDISFTNTKEMAKALYPWLPFLGLLPVKFDSLSKISGIQTPILFVAAENDRRVPAAMTQELFKNKPGAKELVVIPEAEHFNHSTLKPDFYLAAIRKFLEDK